MATPPISIASRGYIVQAANIPQGFAAHLQREGLARLTALAPDGLYLEPRAPLTAVLAAFERCGIRLGGVRSAGNEPSWHTSARPAALARARLSNQRSAEWLPTLPCA